MGILKNILFGVPQHDIDYVDFGAPQHHFENIDSGAPQHDFENIYLERLTTIPKNLESPNESKKIL